MLIHVSRIWTPIVPYVATICLLLQFVGHHQLSTSLHQTFDGWRRFKDSDAMAVFPTKAAVVKGFSLRTMIVKPMGVPIFQEKTGWAHLNITHEEIRTTTIFPVMVMASPKHHAQNCKVLSWIIYLPTDSQYQTNRCPLIFNTFLETVACQTYSFGVPSGVYRLLRALDVLA